jgi:hypothetical protein
VVALLEEKAAVALERHRACLPRTNVFKARDGSGPGPPRAGLAPGTPLKCRSCNSPTHLRRECPQRRVRSGNGPVPGGR